MGCNCVMILGKLLTPTCFDADSLRYYNMKLLNRVTLPVYGPSKSTPQTAYQSVQHDFAVVPRNRVSNKGTYGCVSPDNCDLTICAQHVPAC